MGAWRCPECLINWPAKPEFDYCPVPNCGSYTEAIKNIRPDFTVEEAMDMYRHYEFDKKYATWDRKKPPERLVPTADDRVKYPFRPELGDRTTYGERQAKKEPARAGLHGHRKS